MRKYPHLLRFISYTFTIFEHPAKFVVYFLLGRVFRYRRKVVRANIKSSFPDLSENERLHVELGFYKNLAHVIIESTLVFNLDKYKLAKRVKVKNPELMDELCSQNVSALFISGHSANWEWAGMALGNHSGMHNIAVYLPLSNVYIDGVMQKARRRITQINTLVSSRNVFKALLKAPRPFQTYIIADQSPSKQHHCRVQFLGRSTAFFNGPAKMAHKLKLGMVYVHTVRTGNGFYEVELKLLFTDSSRHTEEEITALFARELESTIQANPSDWLWSHKRWKF